MSVRNYEITAFYLFIIYLFRRHQHWNHTFNNSMVEHFVRDELRYYLGQK